MRRTIVNPADHGDVVGTVEEPSPDLAAVALAIAAQAVESWSRVTPFERAACLLRAADEMEARMRSLMGLIIREAGKSAANAISEVREAVDFLRYYADQASQGFEAHA